MEKPNDNHSNEVIHSLTAFTLLSTSVFFKYGSNKGFFVVVFFCEQKSDTHLIFTYFSISMTLQISDLLPHDVDLIPQKGDQFL